jgi:hypothetical protein
MQLRISLTIVLRITLLYSYHEVSRYVKNFKFLTHFIVLNSKFFFRTLLIDAVNFISTTLNG